MPLSIDNKLVNQIKSNLLKAQKIVILSHMNPDGDAVGSSLALQNWLISSFFCGKNSPIIKIVIPHTCPHDMRYLPLAESILDAESNLQESLDYIAAADTIFCVDFSKASRVLPFDNALLQSQAIKICVDHHHDPDENLFNTIVSVPDLSSTCELLYWLFCAIQGDKSVNDDTARCLYHGINTDTGGFSYANEDPSLYEATAALMHHPLNAADVHNRLFNSYTMTKMKTLAFLLYNRFRVFPDQGFAYIYVSAGDMEELGASAYDLEGLVNYTLMMEQIKVGAMVKETDGKVRLSFRAKNDFDVNVFAHNYFDGGGHTKASGATSKYDFATTVRILETNMLRELDIFNKRKES
ncbi:MAG: bifunctional oligoribonuclease/PAP phosphatase NrnA [Bacteroidales bacterium]|nr:bifunctional oligoribonuclease/PAP phosphatase NrnA [Bacteroidales bacterium]